MIFQDKLNSFFEQTKLLYGDKVYLKKKMKIRNIDLIFITEYPNYNHLTNKVYNLRYEKLLKKIIKSIGMKINHNTLAITILEVNPELVRAPLKKEVEKFKIRLESDIKSHKPKMILGFGKTVGKSLTGELVPLEEMRNMKYEFKGVPVRITYDPLSILNNTDYKRPLWTDLKLIRDYLNLKNIDE